MKTIVMILMTIKMVDSMMTKVMKMKMIKALMMTMIMGFSNNSTSQDLHWSLLEFHDLQVGRRGSAKDAIWCG